MSIHAVISAISGMLMIVSSDAPATREEMNAFGATIRKATFNCPLVIEVRYEGKNGLIESVKVTCGDPSSGRFFVPLEYRVMIYPDLQVRVEPWRPN